MNKINYIANIRIPTEKAHGVQIVKMSEAFAGEGWKVELFVPLRKTSITDNLFTYYGVKKNFKVIKLWCLDTIRFGWLGFWILNLSFTVIVIYHSLFKKDFFYTRDEFIAFCLCLLGKKVIWEVHMGQNNFFVRTLIKRKVPIVAISHGLKDLYLKQGVSIDKIIVAPDGVDLDQFDIDLSQEEAKEKLNLNKDSKLVIYTGSKYSWKGIETLISAKKFLPQDVDLLVVSNRPYLEVPLYLKGSDILILPNTAKEKISNIYTSPMKLFEYMASGRPIVASDIPSIREILNSSNSVLVKPDDAEDLVRGVRDLLENKNLANKISRQAFGDVKAYTWKNRAKLILNFIK